MTAADAPRHIHYETLSIREIDLPTARRYYNLLPRFMRLASLSPDYCAIDAKRDSALTPTYILFEDTAKGYFWLHSVHKGIVPDTDFTDFQSPYGYGGPVSFSVPDLTPEYDFNFLATAEYNKWCWSHNVLAEFIRFHPLGDRSAYSGLKTLNRQTVVVPAEAKVDAKCRNMIAKAEREGVKVLAADRSAITNFAVDYREGLKRLKAEKFYFFNDAYFEALSQWEKAHLLIAEIDEQFVAASIFLEGGDTLEYHLSTTTPRGRETAATNLLIASACTYAKDLGLKQLYLGGGRTPRDGDSLLTFKQSFGGEMKPFYVGNYVHKPEIYDELMSHHFDVPPTSDRVLWWR